MKDLIIKSWEEQKKLLQHQLNQLDAIMDDEDAFNKKNLQDKISDIEIFLNQYKNT